MINRIFNKFKEEYCEENKSKLFDIIQDYWQFKLDELTKVNPSENYVNIKKKLIHNVGICQNYVNIKKKLIYLKIYKCASSSITEYFSTRRDFIPIDECDMLARLTNLFLLYGHDIEEIKNCNIFTVIRNPKSRWISGLNELISTQIHQIPTRIPTHIHKESIKMYIEQELANNIFIFDGHTLPQINCLPPERDLPFISNTILLRLDKNLNQKISSLLGEDVQIKYKNRASTDPNKKNNLNFCKKMFETYCEKNPKYYHAYEFDYRLFNLSQ